MTQRRPYDRHTRALARKAWYILLTRPQSEFTAQEELAEAGYTAAVPSQTEYRGVNRYVRGKREVRYPCMPRYVLIGFDRADCPSCGGSGRTAWTTKAGERKSRPCAACEGRGRAEIEWGPVLFSARIYGVLARDGSPAEIPYRQLARFIASDPRHVIKRAAPEEKFMRTYHEFGLNSVVRVATGSMEGFEFTVEGFDGRFADGHVLIFGRPTPVRFPLHDLEPKDAA